MFFIVRLLSKIEGFSDHIRCIEYRGRLAYNVAKICITRFGKKLSDLRLDPPFEKVDFMWAHFVEGLGARAHLPHG